MQVSKVLSIVLSICFSMYLGHNLVPHHHHAEIVNVPVHSTCPVDHHGCPEDVDDGDSNEHSGHQGHEHDSDAHPLHCHAFNDVVFDKNGSPNIQPQVLKISTLFVDLPANPAEDTDFLVRHSHINIKIPDKSLEYFGARSLRAPPVSA